MRIGSTKPVPINVRIVAATNQDVKKMIAEGLFREDLYYRLQVLSIEIPPLRERREDLLLLSEAFFKQIADAGGEEKVLDRGAKQCLMEYEWPGNVRELRNVIQRISLLSKSSTITRGVMEATIHSKGYTLLPEEDKAQELRINERMMEINNAYRKLINEALGLAHGNKTKAAEILGVSRKTFYRMLEKYS